MSPEATTPKDAKVRPRPDDGYIVIIPRHDTTGQSAAMSPIPLEAVMKVALPP